MLLRRLLNTFPLLDVVWKRNRELMIIVKNNSFTTPVIKNIVGYLIMVKATFFLSFFCLRLNRAGYKLGPVKSGGLD